MKAILLAAAALLVLTPASFAAEKTRAEQVAEGMKEPMKNLSSYHFDPASPLESRVGPAPKFIVDVLKRWDGKSDYEGYEPSPEEAALLRGWIAGLPAKMRQAFRERLIGLYFVKNFTGNGLTDFVVDDRGEVYSMMVLNPVGFGRTLSQTLTLRDASAFSGDAGVKIDCAGDARGMLYTLLHEGTHAYDFLRGVTPYVEDSVVYATRNGRGLGVSWDAWENIQKPAAGNDYPNRAKVHFYGLGGGPALKAEDAPETYKGLAASPFVSLYGSQSWAEDAADLFTFYHLDRALKIRCAVRLGDETVFEPMKPGSRSFKRADRLYGALYK